jgi:hypothetical protein
MYIVAYEDAAEVSEVGCVGASYYGPFASEYEAQEFIEGGGADSDRDATPTILEVEVIQSA